MKITKNKSDTTKNPANFELKVVVKSNNIFIKNPIVKNKNIRIKYEDILNFDAIITF